MRYFKIITSNKEGSFVISEDELEKLLSAVKSGSAAFFKEGILLNPNMAVSVVSANERMAQIKEIEQVGSSYDPPSPFAKLLSDKTKMLSDKDRTEMQEESAKRERR